MRKEYLNMILHGFLKRIEICTKKFSSTKLIRCAKATRKTNLVLNIIGHSLLSNISESPQRNPSPRHTL